MNLFSPAIAVFHAYTEIKVIGCLPIQLTEWRAISRNDKRKCIFSWNDQLSCNSCFQNSSDGKTCRPIGMTNGYD